MRGSVVGGGVVRGVCVCSQHTYFVVLVGDNKTTDEEYNHQGVRNDVCQHRASAAGASLRLQLIIYSS
jgi:hypothetical protein